MTRMLLSAGMIFLLAMSAAQAAGDPAAGKAKAVACAGGHGANGQGVPPNPALAGKSESQLLQALKDFKSGKRSNAVMKAMTAGLSDQDMANLAAYYASLK
ncbi:MAG: c-type cytochrome [Candidatus Sulfotelmatobacter sp.]